jgi:Fic family protein
MILRISFILADKHLILAHKADPRSRILANRIPDAALTEIERTVGHHVGDPSAQEILRELAVPIPLRTLQYRLKHLVDRGRLLKLGEGRWATYRLADIASPATGFAEEDSFVIPLSPPGASIRDYIRQAPAARKPVGYDRGFLDRYRPNVTFYLNESERRHLAALGRPPIAQQPAGTYVRQVLSRLLVDLSWNSSRLEGNTYSLLDTRRLIEFGQEAEGHAGIETQMILNHKDAIEFLVGSAENIGFNRHTLLNLHALLANNLLHDPTAAGRLRRIAVGIERSTFHPLEVPQLIEECFDRILSTAEAIADPFEQAFFIMVQLPYLQPFDDVNKRVSRLAANIPFIRGNLSPLSFTDISRQAYTEATLGIYELNKVEFLKDVFLWTYERSAARYVAVRQSLGEPDPFRLHYRAQLREVVADLIRACIGRRETIRRLAAWAVERIEAADRERFVETAETELTSLHEGNFARYQVRPSEFAAWRKVWEAKT